MTTRDIDTPTARDMLHWKPFPTHLLPGPVRKLAEDGAKALGCDEVMIAAPSLVVCAACIGNSAVLHVKRGWKVPSVLWLGVVAESGQLKTPALDLARKPLTEREVTAIEQARLAPEGAENHARLVVSDVTTEAVAAKLQSSPMGLLLAADELAAWFKSFDAYRNSPGPDAQRWLSAYDASEWIVDRKTDDLPIAIRHASVSVVGGIQPGILSRVLGDEHFDSGLAARLLVCMPPRQRRRWSDSEIAPDVGERYAQLIGRLVDDRTERKTAEGAARPLIRLSSEAKDVFAGWFDIHAERQNETHGREAALLAKIEGVAPRLALVLHLIEAASLNVPASEELEASTMQAGTVLADWFANEGLRLYAQMQESEAAREVREVVDLIAQMGGAVTSREIRDAKRAYRHPGAADAILERLADSGLGAWEVVPSPPGGGRPTRKLRLTTSRAHA